MGCSHSVLRPDEVDSGESSFSDAATSDDESRPYIRKRNPKKFARLNSERPLVPVADAAVGSGATSPATPGVVGPRPPRRLQILTEAQAEQCRTQFWALYSEKWKESIDAKHWEHGRFVYDHCLHGGNNGARELGYLSSMCDAWCFASAEIGFKSNPASWLALNFFCMSHPGNEHFCGRFRSLRQGNLAMVVKEANVSAEAIREFGQMPKKLCNIVAISGDEKHSHRRNMPYIRRKTMRHHFARYLHEFYQSVGCRACNPPFVQASRPDLTGDGTAIAPHTARPAFHADPASTTALGSQPPPPPANCWEVWPPPRATVVAAAAKLQQRLSRMEPCRDGNTRTTVILVNKLLCECGLTPAVFDWPDGAAVATLAEWTATVERGLARWAEIAAAVPADARAAIVADPRSAPVVPAAPPAVATPEAATPPAPAPAREPPRSGVIPARPPHVTDASAVSHPRPEEALLRPPPPPALGVAPPRWYFEDVPAPRWQRNIYFSS